jgi:cyclic pyranopterin phosphate synthase
LGVEKVRVTGGEPLVRKGVVEFVEALNVIAGIKEVVLTTNGILLEDYAKALKAAGLKRINISLDSINADIFRDITRIGDVTKVFKGIEVAKEVGFDPIKINMVYMAGVNDGELQKMMALSGPKVQVRLIELMPIGEAAKWSKKHFASVESVLANQANLRRQPLLDSGVARNYMNDETGGLIGLITPISDHFCHDCDKVRLTSDGFLKVCLLDDFEVDLKPFLDDKMTESALRECIEDALLNKQSRHSLTRDEKLPIKRNMVSMGG